MKLYEGETKRVFWCLDVSGSMNYGSGEVKKIDYARILASCLTYFAFHQRDAVGLLTFDNAFARTFRRAVAPASYSEISCWILTVSNPACRPNFENRCGFWRSS